MKYQIDKTAEQFANDVQRQMILFPDVEDRDFHIKRVIKNNWPELDKETVLINLSLNTVNKKLDAMDRDSNRDPNRWQESKQMGLFNEPAFKVPKYMWVRRQKRSYQEVSLEDARENVDGFLQQTQKEADVLAEAWENKKEKARMITETLRNIDKLIDKARKYGYDPKELTFGDIENAPFKDHPRTPLEVVQDARR